MFYLVFWCAEFFGYDFNYVCSSFGNRFFSILYEYKRKSPFIVFYLSIVVLVIFPLIGVFFFLRRGIKIQTISIIRPMLFTFYI